MDQSTKLRNALDDLLARLPVPKPRRGPTSRCRFLGVHAAGSPPTLADHDHPGGGGGRRRISLALVFMRSGGMDGMPLPSLAEALASTPLAPSEAEAPSLIEALNRQIDYLNASGTTTRWAELHPAQRAVVPLEQFLVCDGRMGCWGIICGTPEILATADVPLRLPGTDMTVDAVQFTAQVNLTVRGTPVTVTERRHLVLIDGTWFWVLSAAEMDAFQQDKCLRPLA